MVWEDGGSNPASYPIDTDDAEMGDFGWCLDRMHSVAAVETALHASKEPDTAGIDRSKGMEERQQWPRPLVERRSLAHA